MSNEKPKKIMTQQEYIEGWAKMFKMVDDFRMKNIDKYGPILIGLALQKDSIGGKDSMNASSQTGEALGYVMTTRFNRNLEFIDSVLDGETAELISTDQNVLKLYSSIKKTNNSAYISELKRLLEKQSIINSLPTIYETLMYDAKLIITNRKKWSIPENMSDESISTILKDRTKCVKLIGETIDTLCKDISDKNTISIPPWNPRPNLMSDENIEKYLFSKN